MGKATLVPPSAEKVPLNFGLRGFYDNSVHDAYPVWSPSGRKIAFARLLTSQDGNCNQWDLYTVNGDGTGVRRLTNTKASELMSTWSPTGRKIAFARYPASGGAHRIFKIATDGSNTTLLAPHGSNPAWSPAALR